VIPHSRPTLGPEDAEALLAALRTGQLAQGSRVAAFELTVARRLRRHGGVATSSGTAALAVALAALKVGPRDEVMLPAYACSALGNAVRYVGAQAILADVGEDLALAPRPAARRLTVRTRAVVVVHPFGHPVDLRPFLEWEIPLVEDCAQALGASREDGPAGSAGTVAVCSFYATKEVATGEGGMVLTDHESVLAAARAIRSGTADHPKAFNFKLTDLAGALGLAQLARLDEFVERRRAIARRYDEALSGALVRIPLREPGVEPSFSRYVVRAQDAGALIEGLSHHGVEAKRAIADPLVLQADRAAYPEAARAFAECVSLPIFPSLGEDEVGVVVRGLKSTLKERGWAA
jgi:perosamine synthetase